MIVCFDLDDTLYDEITYVQSGLKAVAKYLNNVKLLDYSEDDMYFQLTKILRENGRGKVFDIFLKMNGKISLIIPSYPDPTMQILLISSLLFSH